MKRLKYIMILVGLMAIASSCQEEYEPEMIPGNELAGEWYVTYTVGGVDIYGVGYTTMLTYTTAAADGQQIWVTDAAHFWDYLGKVNANAEGLSFGQSDSIDNESYPVKMVIKNGKIIPDGGLSKTKVVVDSIYFEIGFGDDAPGMEYVVSGHMRTGFEEDDY